VSVAEVDGSPLAGAFELYEPRSLDEALAVLGGSGGAARPLAGGTALMLLMRYGFLRPEALVSLGRLRDDLAGVDLDPTGGLRVGAGTTLRELERSALAAGFAPSLVTTLHHLANVRVRNVATLGGHLAHGDPHMDLPTLLQALDARVRLTSQRGLRWLPVSELYLGYYETAIDDDELLTDVLVPAERREAATAYRRFTATSADDWPLVNVAVSGWRDGPGLRGVRVAVGGVGGRTQRVGAVEQLVAGERPGRGSFARAGDLAATELLGPSATSHTATVIAVEVRRALESAFGYDTTRGGRS
jgi:aerobic carbon-monoxide dehydrogenase medium subunit